MSAEEFEPDDYCAHVARKVVSKSLTQFSIG